MPSGHFKDRTLWLRKLREATAKKRIPIDIDLLKKRYLVDKISTYKLQKEFGVSNCTLINRLKQNGVKLRGWSDAQKLIEHENPVDKIGYENWYKQTQSLEARKKRSISHTGKKLSDERKRNMANGIGRGYNNKLFKGKGVGYFASHIWINNNWTKTGICQNCKKQGKPNNKNYIGTEWANIDGKYDRDSKDSWKELCHRCHMLFDRGNMDKFNDAYNSLWT